MFFELQQIEKVETGISNLTVHKQTLDQKSLEAFSSDSNKIENSLMKILKTVLSQSEKSLQTIKQIQDQIEMGYFIPSTLNIEELVYDSSQLPEWFQFVFKKQYQKQKKNLDALSKKTYKMQSLPQSKHNLQKQIQTFRLLIERYQILNGKQKTSLNIMGQAEVIKSKCKSTKQKYQHFCKVISSKILIFLQQSVSKSLNFSNSINTIGANVTNSFNVKLQPQQFQRGSATNNFKQTNPAFQTNYYDQRSNKSADLRGKTMYSRMYNQNSRINNTNTNNFSRLSNDYQRYVPRHINTTVYDFYN